jgi:UDPglucose 6-dehydrogenase
VLVRVVVIGSGYVGLVTGACLAESGVTVVCVDIDTAKVARLNAGEVPIFEPGLDAVMARNRKKGRLTFSTDLAASLEGADAAFVAVGTPPGEDGSADLRQVSGVARSIGDLINHYIVVVTKSTVPCGTAEVVRACIRESLEKRGSSCEFDVASNPEFLKEGDAINDFMYPDRIVIGTDSERAQAVIEQIYRPFMLNGNPLIFMDIASAELTKYAANAMLATRISFMNSISQLCDAFGADVSLVRRGIASDRRIGPHFLYAGSGYGGSCFPKDVRALSESARSVGVAMPIVDAVDQVNELQKRVPLAKVYEGLGRPAGSSLAGIHVAMWGFAFKPNTDDVRDAPATVNTLDLLKAGATVTMYDPVALEHAPAVFGSWLDKGLTLKDEAYAAIDGADILMLITEWPEFRNPDTDELASRMRGRLIVDGRNVLNGTDLADAGFTVLSIGRPAARPAIQL